MLSLRSLAATAILSTTLASASWARAQEGFAIDRYSPPERGSEWHANDSLDLRGRLRPAAGVVLDYGHAPLVAYDRTGDPDHPVIAEQLFAHLGGALVLGHRWRLGANLPVLLRSNGDPIVTADGTFATAEGLALGDPRLTVDYRILGEHGDAVTVAAGTELYLPAGSQAAYASDGTLRALPRLLTAGDLGVFTYAGRLGIHVRPHDASFAGTRLGHELVFGGAAGVRLADGTLLLGPELTGSTLLAGGASGTPVELLVGGKYTVARDYRVGLAGGPGLTQAFGTPDVRVVASFEWAPAFDAARDRDGDGIPDDEDRCPTRPAGQTPDPQRRGCPALDTDGDGIADPLDACPNQPGVADPDPLRHGCPPPPPPPPAPPADTDGDGIPDPQDACPTEPGVAQRAPETNGCPRARLEVEARQIRILQRIEFEYKRSTLTRESVPVLEEVAAILSAHAEIKKVEIQGHTDDVGPDDYNLQLSRTRAEAVRLWLMAHGIAGARLSAVGFGEARPTAPNTTEEGRQANRRVEFHILDSAPTEAVPEGTSDTHLREGAAAPGAAAPDSSPPGAATTPPPGTASGAPRR